MAPADRASLKISVITPSFNQGAFIEETIRSVLDQNYPALDYIVMDGGSTDGTLAVLQKYTGRVRWLSEPDHGQTDAINKGLRIAQGEVLTYLNSDDLHLPGTLQRVADYISEHPDAGWVYGDCALIDDQGRRIGKLPAPHFNLTRMIQRAEYLPQPAVFWRRSVAQAVGEFDATLHYSMDYDYFIRLARLAPGHRLDAELACFRFQRGSKTITSEEKHWRETLQVSERYGLKPWTLWYWVRRARHRGLRVLPAPMQRMIRHWISRPQDAYQKEQASH